jgi:hypothetical protein
MKIILKNFSKISFIRRELNKGLTNTIGNRYESQMNYRKDYYDYNRLNLNLIDDKITQEEKNENKNVK